MEEYAVGDSHSSDVKKILQVRKGHCTVKSCLAPEFWVSCCLQAWINEKNAPDILPFETQAFERCERAMSTQVQS